MSSNDETYREKYLNALDEQERIEKTSKFQIDVLRKALLNISAVAHGLDEQLDSYLDNFKRLLKQENGADLLDSLQNIQKACQSFEQERHASQAASVKSMSGLLKQFQSLQISSDLTEKIKSLDEELEFRLASYQNYPKALISITQLQAEALEQATSPPEGLWQRLKGGKTLQASNSNSTQSEISSSSNEQSSPTKTKIPLGPSVIEHEEPLSNDADLDLSENDEETVRKTEIPTSLPERFVRFDCGAEDDYEKVAERIAITLAGLIERIEPNEIVKHKVEVVRSRIERGMDWYALAVTLEDLRDILLLRYLQVDEDFTQYLQNINDELSSIGEALGLAKKKEQQKGEAIAELSSKMNSKVGNLRQSISSANDLNVLKEHVSDQLADIQEALTTFDSEQATHTSITDELESLLSKVKTIESESNRTKELLQQERHRATHDALTGLPNREAYNERIFAELKRFQRYSHPITIAVCDIDYFKKINDSYGHQAGDKVLRMLAKVLLSRLREVDFTARYGGEEFVILMPETEERSAHIVLDKIREALSKTSFTFKSEPVNITISIGLSELRNEDTVESAFERADKALYKAKNDGRNRCIIADKDV